VIFSHVGFPLTNTHELLLLHIVGVGEWQQGGIEGGHSPVVDMGNARRIVTFTSQHERVCNTQRLEVGSRLLSVLLSAHAGQYVLQRLSLLLWCWCWIVTYPVSLEAKVLVEVQGVTCKHVVGRQV
jgi:hypothetical protein